ncbi:MAG: prolyl oligopeptidase family serine peptidase, partial [Planctomycetota bacterium]
GSGDWEACQAYRDAGYIVVLPILRAENGNPGHFEMMFGEVADVIAAGKAAKKLRYVDPNRIFVSGHSIGGIHAMLAAMMDSPFRAAASFGGTPDQKPRFLPGEDSIPFNRHDSREVALRSPSRYPASLRCPLQIYYGEEERERFDEPCASLAEAAKSSGKTCGVTVVAGDHWQALAPAILESLKFFESVERAKGDR